MAKEKIVDPELYSKDYFLTDNEGFKEYSSGLDNNIHPKFKLVLKYGNPLQGEAILDIGCGRGELIYYCAKRGANVLGIDYSKDAINIAKETIKRLPQNLQYLARAEVGDPVTYDFNEQYDLIFMIEVVEHMHDWQLIETFKKAYSILKRGGRLIITTPNYYYENYLSPLKRIINIPLNLIKWPVRVLTGKYKNNSPITGLKKIFRVKVDRGELNRKMHVNITTPSKLKKMLSDFEVQIKCEDHSKNIISLITQRWCGRDVVVIATKR